MIAIVVQARMGSSRLPGKVLKAISGRPMLSYQIERLRRVSRADRLVVATSVNPLDDAIVRFCVGERVDCMRGPEHNVLHRYAEVARSLQATAIVRLTADCPLIDPELIDVAIDAFDADSQQFDYLTNMLEPSWPYGMAVEVLSTVALREADKESTDSAEREHVTPFVRWRPDRYRLKSLTMKPDLSHHRWTVDTTEDFELVSRIFATLYPRKTCFRMQDVLHLLSENPEWELINRHVVQTSAERAGGKV